MAKATPADVPVEDIAKSKALTEEQKVGEMSRQFEAMLVRQILTQAQKPAFKNTLLPQGGVAGDIYQDMMNNQLADKISSAGSLGIAKELQKQVSHQLPGGAKKAAPHKPLSAVNTPKKYEPPVHATKSYVK